MKRETCPRISPTIDQDSEADLQTEQLRTVLSLHNEDVRIIAQHQLVKRFDGGHRVRCLCGKTMGGGWGWAQHVTTMLYAPHLADQAPGRT